MSRFRYFAYGSNLLVERLAARCPSAEVIGSVSVAGWRLAFQSKSFDGSGKATLVVGTPSDVVHGRLYEIDLADRPALDAAEGADRDPPIYLRRDDFAVVDASGESVSGVTVYLAREENAPLPPWDWYRALIVAGGVQADLPAAEVAALAVIPALPDVEPARRTRREALAVLEAAGFPELARACGAVPSDGPEDAAGDRRPPSLDEIAERVVAAALA